MQLDKEMEKKTLNKSWIFHASLQRNYITKFIPVDLIHFLTYKTIKKAVNSDK